MKIDPNSAILRQECVLIEGGEIVLADGGVTTAADLGRPDNPFRAWLGKLEENLCYVAAFIPDDADRDLFYQARDVARGAGRHMQATVDPPDEQRRRWALYRSAAAKHPETSTPEAEEEP